MISANENDTYSIFERSNRMHKILDTDHEQENLHGESKASYLWIIASAGLVIVGVTLILLCMKRHIANRQTDRGRDVEGDQSEHGNPELGNNFAYEGTLPMPTRTRSQRTSSRVDIPDNPTTDLRPTLSLKSPKKRPIGMATRIPHVTDSNAIGLYDKDSQLPRCIVNEKTQAELLKDLKEYQMKRKMTPKLLTDDSHDKEPCNTECADLKVTSVENSPSVQKLKSSGSCAASADNDTANSTCHLIKVNKTEEHETKSANGKATRKHTDRYKTLDSAFPRPHGTVDRKYSGPERHTLDMRTGSRKRTPRMSDAGTQWAIENHLTRRKSSLKSRLPSLRYRSSSKKYTNVVSLEDLPTELRASATSLDVTRQDRSASPHGSPYKLQFRNSMRPGAGRRILYRNGTRKYDRSTLKKSKKWAKNFEMSVVEESPSFYMSFDTPLPPETTSSPSNPVRKKTAEKKTSISNDHNYEEIDTGGYKPIP